MAVNTDNIEIGEGNMSLQFEGEDVATDVGGCADAVLDVSIKDLDVEVGQFIDPVDNFIVGRAIKFEVVLKEDTLRNFVIASGGDPADITDSSEFEIYSFPANSVAVSKFAELIYTVARVRDKTKYRKVTLYKVKSVGGIKYAYKKDKEVFYKATFKAFADSVHSGKPGEIQRDKLD